MTTVENFFKLIGMLAIAWTIPFEFWYRLVVPNDSIRSRNFAALSTLIFMSILCVLSYIAYANELRERDKADRLITFQKQEMNQKHQKMETLKAQLVTFEAAYDNLQLQLDEMREKSPRVEKRQLHDFLNNMTVAINDVHKSISDHRKMFLRIWTEQDPRLAKTVGWAQILEILRHFENERTFNIFDRSIQLSLLRDQVQQLRYQAGVLHAQIVELERQSQRNEDLVVKLLNQLHLFVAINIQLDAS